MDDLPTKIEWRSGSTSTSIIRQQKRGFARPRSGELANRQHWRSTAGLGHRALSPSCVEMQLHSTFLRWPRWRMAATKEGDSGAHLDLQRRYERTFPRKSPDILASPCTSMGDVPSSTTTVLRVSTQQRRVPKLKRGPLRRRAGGDGNAKTIWSKGKRVGLFDL